MSALLAITTVIAMQCVQITLEASLAPVTQDTVAMAYLVLVSNPLFTEFKKSISIY